MSCLIFVSRDEIEKLSMLTNTVLDDPKKSGLVKICNVSS